MNRKWMLTAALAVWMAAQAAGQLITHVSRLADIDRMLQQQQKLTAQAHTDVWKRLRGPMETDELQAMRFLYAYMPLSDMADYSFDFVQMNTRYALRARTDMKWGKTIPEDVFLHFVLPLRVNNENPDRFREVMYDELRARVQGLSMKDAALEINHWCHEKVTYRGTDARTSAPLSTIRKAFGRCGEESTLAVTALRTVGIPARQVYTPRWAHCDDNHAWVEVWVDGRWCYLGACEPDAELNMGWFSEPATRTMLVHTRTYGHYLGSEEVMTASDRFSELNLTAHYAPVKNMTVRVTDHTGKPVDSARVEFGLYNYAEFYPLATLYTRAGEVTYSSGLGDLLVWASYHGRFGYARVSVADKNSVTICLNHTRLSGVTETMDLVPPAIGKWSIPATPEQQKRNAQRLLHEDSIRNAYRTSFRDSAWSVSLARQLQLSADTVTRVIALSYGNWNEIATYLQKGVHIQRQYVLKMLMQLSDKDLSDATAATLLSQLAHTAYAGAGTMPAALFESCVLSPRVANENLSPWAALLSRRLRLHSHTGVAARVKELLQWMQTHITTDAVANMHARTPLTPVGLYQLRVADAQSRDVFFVAACRANGMAARLNPTTLVPEYWDQNWCPVTPGAMANTLPVQGKLQLIPGDNLIEPQYYLHFSIGKLMDGRYKTLEFEEAKPLSQFPSTLPLDTGYYRLVTGNRQSDGSVMVSTTYFRIAPDSLTQLVVTLRRQASALKATARLALDQLTVTRWPAGTSDALTTVAASGPMVLVLLDPDKEPSKHILNDLGPYLAEYAGTQTHFVFLSSQSRAAGLSVLNSYKLPGGHTVATDTQDQVLEAVLSAYGHPLRDQLPLVLYLNTDGKCYYFSSGYKIGVGEQLLRTIRQLKAETDTSQSKASCVAP